MALNYSPYYVFILLLVNSVTIRAQTGSGFGGCDIYEPNNDQFSATPVLSLQEVEALITPNGDRDIYVIEITDTAPNLKITLSHLPLNYDMWLFNGDGDRVAKSNNPKKLNDAIIFNHAPAGMYYISIFQPKNKSHPDSCYTLLAQVSSTQFRHAEAEGLTNQAEVYPNPADDLVHVELDADLDGAREITIHDLLGRCMLSTQMGCCENTDHIVMDVSSLPAASYLMTIKIEDLALFEILNVNH